MATYTYPMDGMRFSRKGFNPKRFRDMVERVFGGSVRVLRMEFSEDGRSVVVETNRDLDANEVGRLDEIARGHLSDREDEALSSAPKGYMVNTLPPRGIPGEIVFVSDARKVGEGPGLGTGTLAYYSDKWRRVSDDGPVEA